MKTGLLRHLDHLLCHLDRRWLITILLMVRLSQNRRTPFNELRSHASTVGHGVAAETNEREATSQATCEVQTLNSNERKIVGIKEIRLLFRLA